MIVLDLDDFTLEAKDIVNLYKLKEEFPNLKVTLFTILGNCKVEKLKNFYEETKDWIEFTAHGWFHKSNDECLFWNKKDWFDYINKYEQTGIFTKIFKAPNWEMSRLGYQVLKELGWAVAVRKSQIEEVPKGMEYYSFEEQKQPHGHIWLLNSHKESGMFNWNKFIYFGTVSNCLTKKL